MDAVVTALIDTGWVAIPVTMPAAEGRQGWLWQTPDGDEYSTVAGEWERQPPLPNIWFCTACGIGRLLVCYRATCKCLCHAAPTPGSEGVMDDGR